MNEPERLLEAGGALARRLLESGTAERPSLRSLERTMATLAEQERLRSRTWSQRIMHSSIQRKRRRRQWPLLALLATASFLMSVVVSYHWRAEGDAASAWRAKRGARVEPDSVRARVSGREPASVGWLDRAR